MSDVPTRLLMGGFVRLHVLLHAAEQPVFGVEVRKVLECHGYRHGAGTLYSILHQLEEVGYLRSHTEVVGGKRRKYDRATPEGAAALESAKDRLRELAAEVLDDGTPRARSRDDSRRKPQGSRPPRSGNSRPC